MLTLESKGVYCIAKPHDFFLALLRGTLLPIYAWTFPYRQFQAARQQFSRRCASSAVSLWRVWTRHHAASAELHAAAGAMHRTWTASAGLRALDRKARCGVSGPPSPLAMGCSYYLHCACLDRPQTIDYIINYGVPYFTFW